MSLHRYIKLDIDTSQVSKTLANDPCCFALFIKVAFAASANLMQIPRPRLLTWKDFFNKDSTNMNDVQRHIMLQCNIIESDPALSKCN